MKLLKILICTVMVFLFSVSDSICVFALGTPKILESFTDLEDNTITYYLNVDAEAVNSASVIYGDVKETVTEMTTVGESGEVYTLILVDNSQSVMSHYENEVKSLLTSIVSNGLEQEKFLIAEIEEDIDEIELFEEDFETDAKVWCEIIETMEAENKDTDFFLNLKAGMDVLRSIPNDGFKRILVISDGIHETEESGNYYKAEIDKELEEMNYPVTIIGIQNGSSTTKDLQNLFFYARKTGGFYCVFPQEADENTVVLCQSKASDYLRIVTAIEHQSCDGSLKHVRLILDGKCVDQQVQLPVVARISDREAVNESEANVGSEGVRETKGEAIDIMETYGETANGWEAYGETAYNEEYRAPDINTENGTEDALGEDGYSQGAISKEDSSHKERGNRINLILLPLVFLAVLFVFVRIGLSVKKNNRKNVSPNQENSTENDSMNNFKNDCGNDYKNHQYRITMRNVINPEEEYSCLFSDSIIIGRNSANSRIVIPDRAVSGVHCEISQRNGLFYVKDLQSSNGTFVNECRCEEEMPVENEFQIRLGRITLDAEIA